MGCNYMMKPRGSLMESFDSSSQSSNTHLASLFFLPPAGHTPDGAPHSPSGQECNRVWMSIPYDVFVGSKDINMTLHWYLPGPFVFTISL
jgi:hypothetical protein